jgi:hypothetical protein
MQKRLNEEQIVGILREAERGDHSIGNLRAKAPISSLLNQKSRSMVRRPDCLVESACTGATRFDIG